ncbi:MAG: hypothetical protein QOE05_3448 [Actinomycetota bacterium]|jgi:hypothetical protein|nr:hypothetical protein [Actinomycetota bacterium]
MPDPASVSRTVEIDAPPEQVFALVSDLPRMGELSPENSGGHWLGGATAPAVGVRFRGSNRNGWRRWSTVVRVIAHEPPRRFAFEVGSLGLAVSRWTYDVAPRAGGCTVTETWDDRRGRAMGVIGLLASGVADRAGYTGQSIEHTLAALKVRAEQAAAPSR